MVAFDCKRRLTVLATVVAVVLASCGGSGSHGAASASGDPAPGVVVATVGPYTITKAELAHWIEVGTTRQLVPGEPGQEVLSSRALLEQQLRSLISYDWVIGAGAELGVGVSASSVAARYKFEVERQFSKPGSLQKYLRASRQTVADLKLLVRFELTSQRIEASVIGRLGPHASSQAQQQAFARFVTAWRAKWRARTDCRTGYVVQKCRQFKPSKRVPFLPEEAGALN